MLNFGNIYQPDSPQGQQNPTPLPWAPPGVNDPRILQASYSPSGQVPPMNFSDLFTAQNLGFNPPPMSGAQSPMQPTAQPTSGPQNVQMPPELNHLNDVINQYTQDKQSQQDNSGLVQQILSNRFQPTSEDTQKSVFQNAISAPTQYVSPDQVMAQRYATQLSPYSQGLQLAGQSADVTKTNLANDIMSKTGMSKAQAEIALQNAQSNSLNTQLQRDIAEKQFEYANDPARLQAAMMARYMASLSGQPMPDQNVVQSSSGSLPQTMPSPQPRDASFMPVNGQQQSASLPQTMPQPQSGGFNPMGAMLAKSLGLTDMQIGPNGQPMPIPGAMKIENGQVITIGPNGVPTSMVPKSPVAQNAIENSINLLSGKLDQYKNSGNAITETQSPAQNLTNKALSYSIAQPFQAGTQGQTIRSEMASIIMQTMPDYMQAKGLTPGMERTVQGQEMILKAIGVDPGQSDEYNRSVLANLSTIAGTGAYAKSFNQGQTPTISSPSDPAFQQLPAGAQFMTPDGRTMVKH